MEAKAADTDECVAQVDECVAEGDSRVVRRIRAVQAAKHAGDIGEGVNLELCQLGCSTLLHGDTLGDHQSLAIHIYAPRQVRES